MTALAHLIAAEIAAAGPMRLDRYMGLCLGHPVHGYYAAREPFGRAGDFVTAPEISQMFGELLGLWAAQVWLDLGRPAPFRLIELGPGRGTLMADALRAGRAVPGFAAAAAPVFVETSERLRALQARAVPGAAHVARLEDAPGGPAAVLANEFFDALPIRQFQRAGGVWRERLVGLGDGGAGEARLVWGLGGALPGPRAPDGAVRETCAAGAAVALALGRRLAAEGGAALLIDYGAEPPPEGGGDTLQALADHAPADPLAAPGEADLTAHVDFAALAAAVRGGGAAVVPLSTQGALLEALGIGLRARALARAAPGRAAEIEAQLHRLTDPSAMGALFKALGAAGPGQPTLPGLGPAA